MKQPELGKKISELRKAKGLTQEELVEKCNISVRTLQRIETGEVTPRIYTIKTILAALDYDLGTISDNDNAHHSRWAIVRKYVLLETESTASFDFINRQLTIAWISGVLYFLLGLFEGAADLFRFEEDRLVFSNTTYVLMKISVLAAFIVFQRGFVILGGVFKNYLLRITSFVLIIGDIVVIGYDIASIFYDPLERGFILGAEAFTYGGIVIVYGVSLWKLRRTVGDIAAYAGLFEIIAGCFFLTIVLSFIGLFVLMPAELLEIIILYKSIDIMRTTQPADAGEMLNAAVKA
jgi:transcriptional regulator with XRE-family HTH domain